MVPLREEVDGPSARTMAQPGGWLLLTLEFWLSLLLSGCLAVLRFVKSILPKPPRDIAGYVVLVAGAGSSIGSMISEELARHGCCVICLDQDSRKLEKLTEKLRKRYQNEDVDELPKDTRTNAKADTNAIACFYCCDMTNRAEVKEVAREIRSKEKRLDVLVTCVGDSSQDIFDTASRTLMSHYWTTMAFLPWMLDQGQGHVIGVTPVASSQDAYLGSRVAIASLMESIGRELSGRNSQLTFVAVSPVAEPSRTADKEREVVQDVVQAIRTDRTSSTVSWAYELFYNISGAVYSVLALLTQWVQQRGCDYNF